MKWSTLSPTTKNLVQWVLLFFGLLVAIYAATQTRDAPLLILLISLYVIAANFSMPLPPIRVGLVPVLTVVALLITDGRSALIALTAGLALAELAAPLWYPLWQDIPEYPHQRSVRLLLGAAELFTMALTLGVVSWQGLIIPVPISQVFVDWLQLWPIWAWIGSATFISITVLDTALARWLGLSWRKIFIYFLPRLLFYTLFLQPAAVLIALIYRRFGIPAFVPLAVTLTGIIFLLWIAWQGRYVLRRQMSQFASLNRVSEQMRETLDLREVLTRTFEQVNSQVAPERFSIILADRSDGWLRPLFFDGSALQWEPDAAVEPDDFTRWVLEQERPLSVDASTLHFADQHGLALPEPRPTVWFGLPLTRGSRVIGAMVVHQIQSDQGIDRWSRELLVAIARQASDAIDNARQYLETVRLYSSTDEALSERAQQLQAILNATHEGFMMLDRSGRLIMANPVAEEMLDGRSSGDQITETATRSQVAALLGYSQDEFALLLDQLQQGEPPEPRMRIMSLTAGSRPLFFEQGETPVLASDQALMGWLITLRDVTDQIEQETWREQFTNMVVHDLRNPITTLLTSLDTLERHPNRPVKPVVLTGKRVTHHMLDMVDSLMDIARIEAGKMIVEAEAMRLPAVANRVIQDMLPLAFTKEVELTFSYPDDLPAVWADEVLVRRILVNLLDNALKFTSSGGRINGFLGAEPAADARVDDGVRCTIIDTGPGIPAAERDQIFDRFVKFDRGGRQVRGTGVGLTFCKMAVEAQGGRIWVDDAPGGGSCFVLTLPGVPRFEIE
ncbi:MAG: GAF domain-containing sensor histidine kinase [Ardenticatenaceae bacterium]|nr:GAF domain-containing sensor histidine kinase [Ardenticatenaceae bacterium]